MNYCREKNYDDSYETACTVRRDELKYRYIRKDVFLIFFVTPALVHR